ncbi:hypothetical protein L914_01454 [Phytophthora nicotianae]|uniref:RxLR effector protein n=2 Tax=Phytophthora nicotianae TaxID=4792 RepID=W2P3E2_PHYNI|nr:hypothetical protein L914_01454 [Phytophthora nicotianae]ETO84593.1 hypothetical protein F444_01538 [Phytophthora nicotianae P1976]
MNLHHVLFLTVTIRFASAHALLATDEAKSLSLGHPMVANTNEARSLRVAKELGENKEERGNPTSALTSKISSMIPIDLKLAAWQALGKPEAYVKTKLGLDGLEEAQLKAHKNYGRFVKYVEKALENDIWNKAIGGYSTYKFWKDMGFDTITTLKQLKTIQQTEKFKLYKRYAIKFDDLVVNRFKSGYTQPDWVFDSKTTAAEKYARAEIWAEMGRKDIDVKEFLGLKWANAEKTSHEFVLQTLSASKRQNGLNELVKL